MEPKNIIFGSKQGVTIKNRSSFSYSVHKLAQEQLQKKTSKNVVVLARRKSLQYPLTHTLSHHLPLPAPSPPPPRMVYSVCPDIQTSKIQNPCNLVVKTQLHRSGLEETWLGSHSCKDIGGFSWREAHHAHGGYRGFQASVCFLGPLWWTPWASVGTQLPVLRSAQVLAASWAQLRAGWHQRATDPLEHGAGLKGMRERFRTTTK